MARFLIGTVPVTGHINPIIPIARELVSRGHRVLWSTGEKFRLKIEATGATFRQVKHALGSYGYQGMDLFPERDSLRGVDRVKWDLENVFIPDIPKQADDLREALADFPADVVLADSMHLGGLFLHERGEGPPYAKNYISFLPLSDHAGEAPPFGLGLTPGRGPLARARNRALHWVSDNMMLADVQRKYRAARIAYGLPDKKGRLIDDMGSPYLCLQNTVRAFEYPYRHLPPQIHFIGALLPNAGSDFTLPEWRSELESKQRPVVLVTQGTVSADIDELIKPVCAALATEDVLVVATTAGTPFDMPIPGNARVAFFVPYDLILPYVDVLITNGSYGTVQHALSYGVPMLACGSTEDKLEVGTRIQWSGAGLRLRKEPPTADQIRWGVRKILSDQRYKTAAQRLQQDLRRHDAPKEAATLLEELARTGQPVVTPLAPMGEG